jgi:RsiW-degrading membrane proteinase PrsW (M82 family)
MYWMLIAALLPAILLGLYIWRKDPIPEPVRWLFRAALAGVLISIPVAFAEYSIAGLIFPSGKPTTLFGTTIQAFLVAATPEECAKLLALWLILRRNPHFDEHFDGITYAVFVGLGFAAIENVGYVLTSGDGWVTVAAMRALLAVPGHYAFAILMGYYYTKYHFVEHTAWNGAKVILMPILAHGVYDALAMTGSVDPMVGGVCFFVLIWFCIKLQRAAYRKVKALATDSQLL